MKGQSKSVLLSAIEPNSYHCNVKVTTATFHKQISLTFEVHLIFSYQEVGFLQKYKFRYDIIVLSAASKQTQTSQDWSIIRRKMNSFRCPQITVGCSLPLLMVNEALANCTLFGTYQTLMVHFNYFSSRACKSSRMRLSATLVITSILRRHLGCIN